MYCKYCAYEIDEQKIEKKSSSYKDVDGIKKGTTVSYVCPRCGHLITENLNKDEVKSLSRAAHAEVQRGNNNFAFGMGFVSVGAILLIVAILFFFLAKKPLNQHQLVTNCAEFYVFVVLLAISVVLLVIGAIFAVKGFSKKHRYNDLLRDINNDTFVQ